MWQVVIQGVSVGLGLALLIGPSFFALFQTSLERGFIPASQLALGVLTSDFLMVVIAFMGISRLFTFSITKIIFTIVGGCVLVGYGVYMFAKKTQLQGKTVQGENIKKITVWTYLVRGLMTNMANPGTWFFWIFWVGVITAQHTVAKTVNYIEVILFFAIVLITNLMCDMLKAYGAQKLQRWITPKNISIINKVVGVLLVGFGLYLMLDLYFHFNLVPETTVARI
ncbi:MAG: LysE family translocator [Bacteroidales bacterium]|jgi:threonine/homoserine/homoserine lactone efflux protein|nr:LysE family translocator [Bacteroidales bacterium]